MTAPLTDKVKILSWNLNGIRAVKNKELWDPFIESSEGDIFCFQETKAKPEQVELDNSLLPHHYWHSAEKAGYSGTLTLSKSKAESVVRGMENFLADTEGRVLTTEFSHFYLVNVYTPNAKRDLSRLEYRQKWDCAFLDYLLSLEKNKPVVVCGDFNVSHKEIDLANPKTNKKNAGFTPEEREGFDQFIKAGFLDSFRIKNKEAGQYSWWSYRNSARERNIGWRLDYFLISGSLKKNVVNASIHNEFFGSDHCPVSIELSF